MSKLTRWHPFTPLLPQSRNLLFRELFEGARDEGARDSARTWAPRVDVHETPQAYLIRAEIPGLDPAEVEITLKDKTLTLKGEKARAETRDEDTLHILERSYGAFERTFTFPDAVDAASVTAESTHGLLEVTIRKAPEAQPRRIQITASE